MRTLDDLFPGKKPGELAQQRQSTVYRSLIAPGWRVHAAALVLSGIGFGVMIGAWLC